MKSFKHHLTELFDQPIKLYHKSETTYNATYQYLWVNKRGSQNLAVEFDTPQVGAGSKKEWTAAFSRNFSVDVVNKGDASRVFASVIEAFKLFVRKYNPERISFVASKTDSGSRVSLYKSLIGRYASQLGYKQEYESQDDYEAYMTLVKK